MRISMFDGLHAPLGTAGRVVKLYVGTPVVLFTRKTSDVYPSSLIEYKNFPFGWGARWRVLAPTLLEAVVPTMVSVPFSSMSRV